MSHLSTDLLVGVCVPYTRQSPLSPTSPTLPDTAGGGLELDLDLDMELPDEILGDAPASLKSSNPRPTSKAPSSAYGQSLYKYKLANGLL